jgi:carboxyl-terminal processing protease
MVILHKVTRRFISLCLLWALLTGVAQAQVASLPGPENAPLSREMRLKVFDQVWRAVNENYYDRNFNGLDWLAQRQQFRPQAETARDNGEFYRVLRGMIGKLGDAHTRIYSPEDGFDRYRPAGTTVGLTVRRIEGRAVITAVEPTSEAARQGIRAGQVVMQVDGVPVEQALARILAELGASSTPTARDLQSLDRLFQGPRDSQVSVTLLDEEQQARTLILTRRYVEFQRKVVHRMLPHHIGYIEVTGFGPEVERDFDRAMQSLQWTRGMILDLRNNGGGFVSTVAWIASYFFPEDTDLGEFTTRQGRSTRRKTWKARIAYRAPLTVLVSSRSASGSEIFAAAIQERKRGLVFGSNPTTCGCLLGVSRTLRLDDGGKLNISDTDFRTALGKRIEGIGIVPDQHLDLKIADLALGRDGLLETAVDNLARGLIFGLRSNEIEFKLRIPPLLVPAPVRPLPTTNLNR